MAERRGDRVPGGHRKNNNSLTEKYSHEKRNQIFNRPGCGRSDLWQLICFRTRKNGRWRQALFRAGATCFLQGKQ